MKPALKNTMCIFTGITLPARPLSKLRTWNTTIVIFPGVTAPGVLPRVHKWALCPIMRVSPRARLDLKSIHSKLISSIHPILNIRKCQINRILFLLVPIF
jgi:hypothetical protein